MGGDVHHWGCEDKCKLWRCIKHQADYNSCYGCPECVEEEDAQG